jgi:hypothetical protein
MLLVDAGATVGHAGAPAMIPALAFQDQAGHTLDLATLRGQVVVIVYGTRDGLDHHAEWGRRLHGALIGHGLYRAEDPPERRPVRILAMAQMGGIPRAFRPVIGSVLRGHVPPGFSLYLDWDDRMSALFGSHRSLSTVVVGDREGGVRLVTVGLPQEAAIHAVVEAIRRLA